MEIQNLNDINKIARRNTNNVIFNLGFLSAQENEDWAKEFNGLLSDCGCNTGQRYMRLLMPLIFIGVVLLLVFSLLSYVDIILIFISATSAIAVASKVVGIKTRDRKIKELIINFYKKNALNV